MAAQNIFLTFVGGSSPRKVDYRWEDEVSNSRYFQVTALEWMRRGVIPFRPNEVWVVLTERARENWVKPPEEGEATLHDQLYTQAERMGIAIHEVGFDQEPCDQSVWRNFDTLVGMLAQASERGADVHIAVDVTHSFRYFPMLVLTLLHYTYVIQGIQLDLILYGADTGDVLDLTALAQLQEWVLEMSRALKGPDASGVERLVREIQSSVARRSPTQASFLSPLQKFASKWNVLWKTMRLTKHHEVSCAAREALDALDECQRRFAEPAEAAASFYPLLRILHQAREQIEPLCQAEWVPLMLAMVRWYLDRGMIHQAYTTMRELYATHACELAGVDVFNDKVREQLLRWAHGKAQQSKSSAPQAPPPRTTLSWKGLLKTDGMRPVLFWSVSQAISPTFRICAIS
ncbi:TM1812 family CRISPR-associated protein [Alicyclobacillus acidocaldarius]|uniref:CRISPR-associated protein DxTHG motif protein n=1 Tax=Alicyclobacillus acidocaldarius (strain Tc-4-1) TaxID=1048834 RepID=F8IHK2_ALIAT|nr:TM1812 family CRISPR-associated protein [Alicyclobacillus acidocaldarius]AEJ44475.1 CRISPR-associated protein DxTHG motif protein [Alicyclobacillus acidocaldarius subsp. acidocaldarius Tc-4-1]